MRQPLISLSYAYAYTSEFEVFVRDAAAHGFRGVQLIPDLHPNLPHEFDHERRTHLAALIRTNRMRHSLHNVFYDINLVSLVPQVRELGARHAGYGVKDEDYETVCSALLWTFEKALGREFTAPMREAWSAVYHLLAATMREGSRTSGSSAPLV